MVRKIFLSLSASLLLIGLSALPAAAADPIDSIPAPTSADHSLGSTDARIVLIEYSDFQCPFCKQVQPTLKALVTKNKGNVRMIYRHFPLSSIHENAEKAAEASECATDAKGNDGFWAFADAYFAEQSADIVGIATKAGFDQATFRTCLDSGKEKTKVDKGLMEASGAQLNGTPSILILDTKTGNRQLIAGAYPEEHFQSVIDAMLGGTWKKPADVPVPEPTPVPTGADAPVQDVPSYDPRHEYLRGSKTARFVVVEYMNFSEPFSARLQSTLRHLIAKRSDVAWIIRPADLAFLPKDGMRKFHAVTCMGKLGGKLGFWRAADSLTDRFNRNGGNPVTSTRDLTQMAWRLHIAPEKFLACLSDSKTAPSPDAATAGGINGLPWSVVIDRQTGRQEQVFGAVPLQSFIDTIDKLAGKN